MQHGGENEEDSATVRIAVQEHLDGKAVDWMEKVLDEQYSGWAEAD